MFATMMWNSIMACLGNAEDEITTMIIDEFREENNPTVPEKESESFDMREILNFKKKCKVGNQDFIRSLKSCSDLNRLTKCICAQFNEKNVLIIESIACCIGKEHAIMLVQDTLDIEEKGGMLTEEGTRRSPGGVFVKLVESRKYVSELKKEQSKEVIRSVNKINKTAQKNKKKRLKQKALKIRLKSENLKELVEDI